MPVLKPVVNVISTNNNKKSFSRLEILSSWNKYLESGIETINDLCTGAAYCCLMDILFPGTINLKRVKFQTIVETDFIHNFKMLQQSFKKLRVSRTIPIDKLVQGKFQDNYEFALWFRLFFDANFTRMPEKYDVLEKRNQKYLEMVVPGQKPRVLEIGTMRMVARGKP